MKLPKINPEVQARDAFTAHVQSIAFNLTLSRQMIDVLRVVRDYGFPHIEDKQASESDWATWKEARNVVKIDRGRMGIGDHYVTFMRALERRGLIIFNPKEWNNREHLEPNVLLSHAGELVCDLLVEARLMPMQAEEPVWMKKVAKR